jgi:hypothetical protein
MISDSSGPPALAQVASSTQPISSLTDPEDLRRLSDAIGLLDENEIGGLLGLIFIDNRDLDRDTLEELEGLVEGRPERRWWLDPEPPPVPRRRPRRPSVTAELMSIGAQF